MLLNVLGLVDAPPSPLQPGIAQNCNKFYLVKPHDTCFAIAIENSITTAKFFEWNKGAGNECRTLWAGYYACIGVADEPAPTPVNPVNGVKTPSPIQAGMVTECNMFHHVESGQNCHDVERLTGASVENLVKWNPAIGEDCTSMWANTHLCVGVKSKNWRPICRSPGPGIWFSGCISNQRSLPKREEEGSGLAQGPVKPPSSLR